MSRRTKSEREARRLAKAGNVSYQAALRAKRPEASSFLEQMADLGSGPTRIYSYACCGSTFVFRCPIQPGFADFEQVLCPKCGKVLDRVRCDWGSPELVREVKGDANAGLGAHVHSDGSVLAGHTVERKKRGPKASAAPAAARIPVAERTAFEEGPMTPEEILEQLAMRGLTDDATPFEHLSPFMLDHTFAERGRPIDGAFERLALKLLGERPHASAVARTLAAIDGLVNEVEWRGAADATTAIGYLLLREQGVEALACRGAARRRKATFSHAWIQVGDDVFDVAIGMAPDPRDSIQPVVAGRHIASGKKSAIAYGVAGAQLEAAHMRYPTMKPFLDGFPGHTDGLWGVAAKLAPAIGLEGVTADELRRRHADARWTVVRGDADAARAPRPRR
jgi:Transglutaminase-like superfamily